MDVRSAGLALPATAAAVLLAVKGPGVLVEDGARSFAVLAITGVAALLTLLVADRLSARRRSPALPPHLESLLRGAASALGHAALAFDPAGRLVWANEAAVELSGESPAQLAGRSRRVLGDDVAMLLQGLGRGPASGRVTVLSQAGAVAAEAAAVRIPGRTPFDVVVLRLETTSAEAPQEVDDADLVAEPPPLPAAEGAVQPASRPSVATTTGSVSAICAHLQGPLARASASAALLRLVLPPGLDAAGQQLTRIERELRDAEAALAAVMTPLPAASPQVVDLDAMVAELLAGNTVGDGVHVSWSGAGARAVADPAHLRRALHHALRLALDAMPSGGVLSVRTVETREHAVVEIADTGAVLDDATAGVELPLAERLVAAQNGHLERRPIPGRGSLCRIVLPAATAIERAVS